MWVPRQRCRDRVRQHRRQDRHQIATVCVLVCHKGLARSGVIRAGGPGGRVARRTGGGADLPRTPWIGGTARLLRARVAPRRTRHAAPTARRRKRHLESGSEAAAGDTDQGHVHEPAHHKEQTRCEPPALWMLGSATKGLWTKPPRGKPSRRTIAANSRGKQSRQIIGASRQVNGSQSVRLKDR